VTRTPPSAHAGTDAPLAGVRVLAVEQMIAAPWATQMLARLGADVIKVEHPTRGESGRAATPFVTDPQGRRVGATFLRNNLDKRSIGIDLDEGADLVARLADRCDVLVENFRAGTLARRGLDYATLAARNPRLIYVSITGFGTTTESPYESWPAYASIAEAMSGVYEWGRQADRPPVVNPVGGLGDIGSGMFAVMGILTALLQREQTGKGQHVDVAMFDAMVSITDVVTSLWSLGAREKAPGAILDAFAARDGWFVAQVSREHQFERLAHEIGRSEWLDDPRLATRQGWVDHLETVIRPGIEQWAAGRTKLDACAALATAGVPCGPCNGAEDVLADPHLAQRRMLAEFTAGEQSYVVPGNPVKLSAYDPPVDRRGPWLGEHTDDILHDLLGLGADEIDALRADGTIG
jgi:crotonobetainyl-CoA:carnitine CoA-transferase CaiB-like acyl-CoA transferase